MTPTELSGLIVDQPEKGLFEVSRRLFNDAEIFELEMRHIFERTWLYLCHESQVAQPYDFFTTHMGRQPVFVSRDAEGELHAFINACAHRGAVLCRTSRGNRKFHVCPYHGWAYDAAGRNVEIKDRDSGGYPAAFEQASHDLTRIARIGTYKGFVFGSLSPEVEPLEDYLADAKPFMDMLDAMSEQGAEILPGASTYRYRGNWKMQAENGIDGYHFTTIHANYVGVLGRRAQLAAQGGADKVKMGYTTNMMQRLPESGCYDLQHGHSLIWIDFPIPENRPLWQHKEQVEARVGPELGKWMLKRQRNVLIYPNVQLMEQASSQIRVFRPLAHDLTEVKIYCIAPKGESAQMRERRVRQYEDFFNATGMATPDDLAVFERCQDGFEGRLVQWQQGYDRGLERVIRGPDENARALGLHPAGSAQDATDEILYHGQYREWLRLMRAGLERDAGTAPVRAQRRATA
jgi:benzoate/toluate 1,2-dioxygenase subunit alpha